MTPHFLRAILPVLMLAANVTFQLVSIYLFRNLTILKSVIMGFLTGFSLMGWIEIQISGQLGQDSGEFLGNFLINAIAYICLSYCYFGFIGLVESARRTTILREIDRAGGYLSETEILRIRSGKKMAEFRMNRLISKGQIRKEEDRLYIQGKPIVLRMAQLVTLMKVVVLGKKSEFEI